MEAEKIFCKNLSKFCEDNDINKNSFYKNIETLLDIYDDTDNNQFINFIKKDPRKDNPNLTRNKDYRIKKLPEPLLALMIKCTLKNKQKKITKKKSKNTKEENIELEKNKMKKLKNFLLNDFINYNKFTVDEIQKLPKDLSTQIIDTPTYEFYSIITEFLPVFLDKVEYILDLILSFEVNIKKDTVCSILCKLNDIIELLHNDYNEFNESKDTDEKLKDYEFISNNSTLDKVIALKFEETNNLSDYLHDEFINDKKNNPSIYSIKKNVINYPDHYYLDSKSKREDLFMIQKKDFYIDKNFSICNDSIPENIVALFEHKKPVQYIQDLLMSSYPQKFSLRDFISIYKDDSFDQVYCLSDFNLIYSDILDDLYKNINLAENFISKQIYFSSILTTFEFRNFNKMLEILYNKIINPNQLDSLNCINELLDAPKDPLDFTDSKGHKGLDVKHFKLIDHIYKTKLEEFKNINRESDTYRIDVFLKLYTNDEILNLILNSITNKHNEIKYKKIINLASNIKIDISHLVQNKNKES